MDYPLLLSSGRTIQSVIVEESCDFIGLTSLDGTELFLNAAGRRLVGLDLHEDVTSYHFLDFHFPEFRSTADEIILPQLRKTGRWTGRTKLKNRITKSATDVIATCFNVIDPNTGEPDCFGTIQQAVVDGVHIAHDIRVSEERLAMAVRATNEGVWDCDLESKSVWWNEQYDALFGGRPRDTASSWQWWIDNIHPDDRDRVRRSLESVVDSSAEFGDRWEEQYLFKRRDGSYAYVRDRAIIARNPNGDATRILGAMQDVTELRRAQIELESTNIELAKTLEELRATERKVIQQERLSAMGELAAGVSHNLNNLLSPAALLIDVLLNEPGLSKSAKKSFELIRSTTIDAVSLVKQLGSLYGRENLKTEAIDLKVLLQEVVSLTRGKWQDEPRKSGLEILIDCQFEHVPMILGAASDLRQVFTNLIFNAVDAMPAGGTIQLQLFQQDDLVVVEVADDGSGMTVAEQSKCFEPFFTTKDNGSGLGLATSVAVIERIHGKLAVVSETNQGSTFRVEIPIATELPDETISADVGKRTQTRRILYIEDDPVVRNAMVQLIGYHGHEINVAEDGPAGVLEFQKNEYDVVISDFSMRGMNGRDVAVAIKEIDSEVMVILVTGWPISQLPQDDAPKEDHILEKPLDFEALNRILEGII